MYTVIVTEPTTNSDAPNEQSSNPDVILDFDKWVQYFDEKNTPCLKVGNIPQPYFDKSAADFLRPIVDCYATAPIGYHPYKEKMFSVKTVLTNDIYDFRLSHLIEGKKIVLYQCLWHEACPSYHTIDPETFDVVKLEKPIIVGGQWRIRYADL